jgi:hypothetical protein
MLKESGNCVLVRFDDGEGPQKGKFAITRCDETIGELVHPAPLAVRVGFPSQGLHERFFLLASVRLSFSRSDGRLLCLNSQKIEQTEACRLSR